MLDPIQGGTRITLNGDIAPDGLPGPLTGLNMVASLAFKHGMTRNLAVLKQLLES